MYQLDRDWGDSYVSQVIRILMQLLPYLIELNTASIEMDTRCATDFTINLKGGNIAVRLRRPECRFRDLTIRSRRDSGTKTELEKIKEGHGFRYFYGWIDENNEIAEWILVDLDKVRKAGLLEIKREEKPNYDGTYFIAIRLVELEKAECLIIRQLSEQTINKFLKPASTLSKLKDTLVRFKQTHFVPDDDSDPTAFERGMQEADKMLEDEDLDHISYW